MNHRISQITFTPISKKRDALLSSAYVSLVLDDLIQINSIEVKKFDQTNEYDLLYPTFKYGDQAVQCFIPVNKQLENFLKREIYNAYEAHLENRS